MAFLVTEVDPSPGYSAQAIEECIDYELKSADNPYVPMNFCKCSLWLTLVLKYDMNSC